MKITVLYNLAGKKKKINFTVEELEEKQVPNKVRKLMKERLPHIKEWRIEC